MTLAAASNVTVQYTGNGVTTAFAYGYKFQENTDLVLYRYVISTGIQTTIPSSEYTITGAGLDAGGTVTFGTAPTSDHRITITRDTPAEQESDYVSNDGFPAAGHEVSVDKIVAMIQELKTSFLRTLRKPFSATYTMPDFPTLASGFLYCDGTTLSWRDNEVTTTNYGAAMSFGADAAKAAVPGVGAIYIATDTFKFYKCYVAGTWSTLTVQEALVLTERVSGPITAADQVGLYAKEVGGVTELFYRAASSGAELQLTSAGAINVPAQTLPKDYISGAIISVNATDPTNDLDITATLCRSAADDADISVAALTKRIDASWTAGNNGGFLDTGAIGASENLIYIFAISKEDGTADYLASISATAPTMPTGYVNKRLIGGRRWDGAKWLKFYTQGVGRMVDVWYDDPAEAGLVIGSMASTTFADFDAGDGGNECVPSTAVAAYVGFDVRSDSSSSGLGYWRNNGSVSAGGDYSAILTVDPAGVNPRCRVMLEVPVDADGIFEVKAGATSTTVSAAVRGFREVR